MKLRRLAVPLATAALFLAACGDDDDSSSNGGGSSDSAEAASVTYETTEPSKGKVKIDGPTEVDAGLVDITLRNSGKGPHDLQILRVEGDRTVDQVLSNSVDSEEGAPIPDWISGGGGLGTVAAGESATVTQVLEPGRYVLADTESGQGSEQSNSRNGGVLELEVTGDQSTAELPQTEASITAEDFSFEAEGLKPGKNRLTFENAGEQLHHVIAMPLAKGATIDEAKEFFTTEGEPQGPPPVDFENGVGTAVIDGGEAQVAELDFEQGKYALVCFITNRDGGPPHVAMGMIDEVDVK